MPRVYRKHSKPRRSIARNVVLVAPAGLGKTMIAQNIVHRAILAGHGALFITASELVLDLADATSTPPTSA